MKAVVFAYHTLGVIGLRALKDAGFDIAAIFSHEDDPFEKCWFESVANWATENRVQIFLPEDVNTPEWLEKIRVLRPDAIFSFYYRRLLCGEILAIPHAGAFNLHGSLLPAYRGRCPVNWVLVNGETCTGVTLHHMVERADAGDVVAQRRIEIDFADTAETLYGKMAREAKELLDETLPLIASGSAPRRKQDLESGSYFSGRGHDDGKIDWNKSSVSIYNLIRAVTSPYPGAFAVLPGGEELIIWKARPEREELRAGLPNGAVFMEGGAVYAKTADGRLRLITVGTDADMENAVAAAEFFKGRVEIVLM